jgi:HAD superfamily phosphoserine phosphatase-like hydrolase
LNVYDFDNTIYDGDSTKDFYRYCLQNRWSLARYWPRQAWAFFLHGLGLIDRTQCKERFYVFMRGLPDMDNFVYDFWRRNIKKIKHFYKMWQRPDDLIISASPDFLLVEACRRLGVVYLIASRVDPKTGRYCGKNCGGEEKVRRFRAEYPHREIEGFYSDSLSDGPMAAIAQKSYLVAGEELLPWSSLQH